MDYRLLQGNCLDLMAQLPAQSIHAIITDLPYGTTYCHWDSILDLKDMWEKIKRILIDGRCFVTTASQPFTSVLVMSNPSWFRHAWVWNKVHATNFANSRHQPMKIHEDILVFSSTKPFYNPQKTRGAINHRQGKSKANKSETRLISERTHDDLSGMKFPQSIQIFEKHSSQCGLHPTQKPVSLYNYLVETYTNPGDTVLDICMGSGTTGVSCAETGRNFIGMENDPAYFDVAEERISTAYKKHEGAVPLKIEE